VSNTDESEAGLIPRVSVIGAGAMGGAMTGVLLRAGAAVTVYDVRPEICREMTARGASVAESALAAAQVSDTVLFSLPHEDALAAVLEPILEAGCGNRLFLDTTTCGPRAAEKWAACVVAQGGDFLDTPVKGGVHHAERGTLSILVGGTAAAFGRALPVLHCIGDPKKVIHVGPSGQGHAAKLVNQAMQGIEHWGITELFALTARLGADPQCILDHLLAEPGFTGGRLSRFAQGVLERHYGETHYVTMMGKDMRCFLSLAEAGGTDAPLARATAALYADAEREGAVQRRDFNAVAHYEKQFGGPLLPDENAAPSLPCEQALRVAATFLHALYVAEVAEVYAAARNYGVDLATLHRYQFGEGPATGIRDGAAQRLVAGDFRRDGGLGRLAAELTDAAARARSLGAETPLLDVCARQFTAAASRFGDCEPAALIHLWEDAPIL
jgi:3-hydroxyisobutyrate dehydrogenase